MNSSKTLKSAWRQQAVWSQSASQLKASLNRGRVLVLALVVSTALLETLAAQLASANVGTAAKVSAGMGAILMALAAFLQGRSRSEGTVSKWVRARAASEALKEQIYRYLTGSGVYDTDQPEAVLRNEVAKILNDVEDLEVEAAKLKSSPGELPAVHNLKDYVEERVEGQMDGYYRRQARKLAGRRDSWRRIQTILMAGTAGLSAAVAYLPELGLAGWVAVLTTVAGALGAHVEASRYEHLIVSYRATALRLEALRDEWCDKLSQQPLKPEQRNDFVDRCEDAISIQNQAWLAGWAKQVKAKEAS